MSFVMFGFRLPRLHSGHCFGRNSCLHLINKAATFTQKKKSNYEINRPNWLVESHDSLFPLFKIVDGKQLPGSVQTQINEPREAKTNPTQSNPLSTSPPSAADQTARTPSPRAQLAPSTPKKTLFFLFFSPDFLPSPLRSPRSLPHRRRRIAELPRRPIAGLAPSPNRRAAASAPSRDLRRLKLRRAGQLHPARRRQLPPHLSSQ